MFERISNSFAMAHSSWQILWRDKKLIVFPILSGIGFVLVVASFLVPLLIVNPAWMNFGNIGKPGNDPVQKIVPWVVAFAFYFCCYFVTVFCNAALMSCAIVRFNGGEPSVGDGVRAAMARLPQIVAWSLVSATVGVILKAVENAHEKAGRFIAGLLGTAWSIMTYFVVPVLVVENVGPFQAISRSMAVLKKTWGEALVGNFSLGFYSLLLALPGVALAVVGFFLIQVSVPLGIAMFALAGIYFLGHSAVCAAMHGIYVAALYQYAVYDTVPSGFDHHTMRGAFARK